MEHRRVSRAEMQRFGKMVSGADRGRGRSRYLYPSEGKLRSIETCLSVRITWSGARRADANERRDWRTPCWPHRLIPSEDAVRRRRTRVDQYRLRPGLDDHRSVPVGLSVGSAPPRRRLHTLLDAGSEFYPHLGWQAARRSSLVCSSGSRAIYVVDRGYVDFARLYVLHQAGAFFVTRAKSNIDALASYSAPTDRSTGIICDQTISLDGFYTRQDYPELLRRITLQGPRVLARRWSSSPTTSRFRPPPSARSTKAAGRWNSSSSGSSSIFGSSSSTARRRTR